MACREATTRRAVTPCRSSPGNELSAFGLWLSEQRSQTVSCLLRRDDTPGWTLAARRQPGSCRAVGAVLGNSGGFVDVNCQSGWCRLIAEQPQAGWCTALSE